MSKATIQPPFKSSNMTVNGTTYQINYSHGSYNGQDSIKVWADGGTDPTELMLNYLTANIFGVQITYGEFQQFIVSYPGGNDEHYFQAWFNPLVSGAGALYTIRWTAITTAVGIGCPPAVFSQKTISFTKLIDFLRKK